MRKVKKRLGSALLALALASGIGVGTAAPSQAALADCSSGYACFWDATGFEAGSGGSVKFQYQIPNFSAYGFSNKASSLYNHGTECAVWFYSGTYQGGYRGYNTINTYWADLSVAKMGSSGLSWNNQIESGYFCQFP